jgi:molybdopterin converting factor small subunit
MEQKAEHVRVRLKLFANHRRYLPAESTRNACDVAIPLSTSVTDLLARFGVPSENGTSVVLINGRDGTPEQVLESGDVVAVFPAMAGG